MSQLEDVFKSVEANTKYLVDASATNERASASLEVMQIILAGMFAFDIIDHMGGGPMGKFSKKSVRASGNKCVFGRVSARDCVRERESVCVCRCPMGRFVKKYVRAGKSVCWRETERATACERESVCVCGGLMVPWVFFQKRYVCVRVEKCVFERKSTRDRERARVCVCVCGGQLYDKIACLCVCMRACVHACVCA